MHAAIFLPIVNFQIMVILISECSVTMLCNIESSSYSACDVHIIL
jgi:hypothetical protein